MWLVSLLVHGIRFDGLLSLVAAAGLLGFVNACVRPLLILLTLPLTVLSFGAFLLVINALMLQFVSSLVRGFTVRGFWTAVVASVLMTLVGIFLEALVAGIEPGFGYMEWEWLQATFR